MSVAVGFTWNGRLLRSRRVPFHVERRGRCGRVGRPFHVEPRRRATSPQWVGECTGDSTATDAQPREEESVPAARAAVRTSVAAESTRAHASAPWFHVEPAGLGHGRPGGRCCRRTGVRPHAQLQRLKHRRPLSRHSRAVVRAQSCWAATRGGVRSVAMFHVERVAVAPVDVERRPTAAIRRLEASGRDPSAGHTSSRCICGRSARARGGCASLRQHSGHSRPPCRRPMPTSASRPPADAYMRGPLGGRVHRSFRRRPLGAPRSHVAPISGGRGGEHTAVICGSASARGVPCRLDVPGCARPHGPWGRPTRSLGAATARKGPVP